MIASSGRRSLLAGPSSRRQAGKLRRLIADARDNVPFYRRLYEATGQSDLSDSVETVLSALPIIHKSELVAVPDVDRLNRRYPVDSLTAESTTGSTGQPFTLYLEKSYIIKRNFRFLHGLLSAGYRPWHRLLMLTDRFKEPRRVGTNRYYEPVEQPTAGILEAYQRIAPNVLYGFLTPLRLLAGHMPANCKRPKLVISTAEMLDSRSREQLESAFGCRVCDFYGMTEMGLIAWQLANDERYIFAFGSVLTELIPHAAIDDHYRLVVTNLDLLASPIIRFDSGDLARVQGAGKVADVMSIDGRVIDTIITDKGADISPYRITDALRDVRGLRRFKITQRTLFDFLIEAEADDIYHNQIKREVHTVLDTMIGNGLTIDFRFHHQIITDGSVKFRPVESNIGPR